MDALHVASIAKSIYTQRKTAGEVEPSARAAGASLLHPVEANEVFVKLGGVRRQALRNAGFEFYDWGAEAAGPPIWPRSAVAPRRPRPMRQNPQS